MKIKRKFSGHYEFKNSQGVSGDIRCFDTCDYIGTPLYRKWIVETENHGYSDLVSTYREAKQVASNWQTA